MNCCNQDCNQGRTCPNRKAYKLPTTSMFAIGIALLVYIAIVVSWQ